MNMDSFTQKLESPKGSRAAWIVLGVLVAIIFGLNLSSVGFWEPWEASEFLVAEEYATRGPAEPSTNPAAPSYNAVVPTLEGEPVGRSLLKVWLMSLGAGSGEVKVGALELKTRAGFALALWVLVMVNFAWVRKRFSTRAGLISGLVFATFPVIFIASHNLATEVLFVVTTSLAFMAWFEFVYAQEKRAQWLGLFTAAMTLVFLDQRLFGVLLVLVILGVHALTEAISEGKIQKRRLIEASASIGLSAVAFAWAWGSGDLAEMKDVFIPHRGQIVSVLIPLLLSLGLFWAARDSRPGQAFWSRGWVGLLALTAVIFGVGWTYGAANPTLLQNGEVFGKIPVLTFFLEHEIFGTSLVSKHMTFDLWVRQIGFAIVPWVGIVPLGLAYLGRATRLDAEDVLDERTAAKRLVLVWAAFSAVLMIFGSIYSHYFFPGFLALAIGVGVMFADDEFWDELRQKPLALYAMGFFAVAAVMMVGKDLERFPARFVEVYTVLQDKLDLEEDFSFGRAMKVLKYAMMATLVVYFFGLVSWAGISLRRAPGALQWLKRGPKGWFVSIRDGIKNLAQGSDSESERPFEARSAQKEAFRAEDGLIPRVAGIVESQKGFVFILLGLALVTTLVYQTKFIPDLTNHLSQRGVFETYQESAEADAKLYRYDVADRESSVYLQDLETIANAAEFRQKFASPERLFAVIPRDNLAKINQDIRRQTKQNLVVLDARSSRLLLVSNQLEDGEKDHNYVAESIIEDESVIQNPLLVDADGQKVHPKFDGQLEMLGVSYDRPAGKDGHPVYKWGETAVIDYYFRVLNRVPGNQKIFVHVDTPGNRINGDHYPNDGWFPTNLWLPGDVVRSRHHLKIENYSTPGIYNLNFGFFVGSNRMKVTPRAAHDGQNRVTAGKIRVEAL